MRRRLLRQLPQILPLSINQARIDCLQCGGKNTLSVSRVSGNIVWHCFRASCGVRGAHTVGHTVAQLKEKFHGQPGDAICPTLYVEPDHFTSWLTSADATRYLERFHCTYALMKGLAHVRYDPKMHRVCFICYRNGTAVGAIGRSLQWDVRPKWWKYDGDTDYYSVGDTHNPLSTTAVIVEDAPSACAITQLGFTGIALLGTNLNASLLGELRKYSRIIIALDMDATGKALALRNRLCYYVGSKVSVKMLDDDIKYLPLGKLEELFGVGRVQ